MTNEKVKIHALCAEQLPELRGMFERILCVARSSDGPTVGNIQLADRLIDAVVSWSENFLAQPEPQDGLASDGGYEAGSMWCYGTRPAPEPDEPTDEGLPPRVGHILRLAEIIREVDGSHDKGAAALAEAILSHPGSRWSPTIEPEELPPGYIDAEHTGHDREMLEIFNRACRSEGGTADEIHLRGLKAVRALAQPEPEGLTDEEILALAESHEISYNADYGRVEYPFVEGHDMRDELLSYSRALIALRAHPTIKPVPVAERLPGPEDCAPWPDDPTISWCWYAREHEEGGWRWRQDSLCNPRAYGFTHWLPHHALPVPGAEVQS